MIFPAIIITLAFLHMVTGSPGADPGSTLIRSIKDASKRIKVKRAGFGRGLKECRKQFKDELWDCSFYYENMTGELPANRETAVIHAITTAGILQEIISQCAANEIIECSCNGRSRGSHECKNSLTFAVTETKSILRTRRQGNYERRQIDINNQMVGIEVFKGEYRNCRGSLPEKCNIWQQVANELKNKYHSTINNTQQVNSTFQGNLQLSYRDLSPDYCVRNVTAGSPGLRGRVCGRKIRQCRSLCEQCGLTLGVEQRGSPGNCKDCPDIYSVTVCS